MDPLVPDKVRHLDKGFATLIASVRLLSSMNLLMGDEVFLMTEGFSAFLTLIGFLARVASNVYS